MTKFFIVITTSFMTGLCASQAVIQQSDKIIKFVTSDNVTIEAPKDLFKDAGTIKNVLTYTPQEAPVDLPEINSQTLARVIEFLKTGTLDTTITHEEALQLLRASDYLDLNSLRTPSLRLLGKKIPWNLNDLQNTLGNPLLEKSIREEIAKNFTLPDLQSVIIGDECFKSIASKHSWTTDILTAFSKLPRMEHQILLNLIECLIKSSVTLPIKMGISARGVLDRVPSLAPRRDVVVYTILLTPEDENRVEIIKALLAPQEYKDLVARLVQYFKPFIPGTLRIMIEEGFPLKNYEDESDSDECLI